MYYKQKIHNTYIHTYILVHAQVACRRLVYVRIYACFLKYSELKAYLYIMYTHMQYTFTHTKCIQLCSLVRSKTNCYSVKIASIYVHYTSYQASI